jgi:HK97 family phage major capsid protein
MTHNEIVNTKIQALEMMLPVVGQADRVAMEKQIDDLKKDLHAPALTVQGFGSRPATTTGGFNSLGQQLKAVAQAMTPGGQTDPRLFQAAATGLNESVPSEGGFLVQNDFNNDLLAAVYQTSPFLNRCRRYQISSNANSIKLNAFNETSRASTRFGGVLGYWLAEADEKTASKPAFRQVSLELKKVCGLCYATDELLGDAAVLEEVIRRAFVEELQFQISDAVINGSGAGQPLGILNSGCLVTVPKESGQKAATIVAENVINMYSRLLPGAERNAVWLINKNVLPQLMTMSLAVGTGGIPVYMPANALAGQPFQTMFGCPVIAIEQAATLGTVGDIILADLSGYALAEKGGIQSAMSIHVRFQFDESCFRFVYRVDGSPVLASALTPYKGSATQSFFVALATRS